MPTDKGKFEVRAKWFGRVWTDLMDDPRVEQEGLLVYGALTSFGPNYKPDFEEIRKRCKSKDKKGRDVQRGIAQLISAGWAALVQHSAPGRSRLYDVFDRSQVPLNNTTPNRGSVGNSTPKRGSDGGDTTPKLGSEHYPDSGRASLIPEINTRESSNEKAKQSKEEKVKATLERDSLSAASPVPALGRLNPAYFSRYRIELTPTAGNITAAEELAQLLGTELEVTWENYLKDPGARNKQADNKHPVQWLKYAVDKYRPDRKELAAASRRRREEEQAAVAEVERKRQAQAQAGRQAQWLQAWDQLEQEERQALAERARGRSPFVLDLVRKFKGDPHQAESLRGELEKAWTEFPDPPLPAGLPATAVEESHA